MNRSNIPPLDFPLPLTELQERMVTFLESGESGTTRAVEFVLSQAAYHGASDIHFEPWADSIVLRFRIDGILHDVAQIPGEYRARITARIKVMAQMVVYQKEKPQDGRIAPEETESGYAMRVSSFPTINGEKIVVRILGATHHLLELDDLGFGPDIVATLRKLITRSQGVILLTGPSSSGKTTTIFALLRELIKAQQTTTHVITIEDPVEYRLDKITQTQINPRTGLTFQNALRSILRQDPEVIMVGEIRDVETAEMVIQAGLTGHLVISTIHSGTACGVFTRLLDMGIEPYLVASAVTGVLAQRLVRINCHNCSREYTPDQDTLDIFGTPGEAIRYIQGVGCDECQGIGYRGRVAIGELLLVNQDYTNLVLKSPTTAMLQDAAVANHMRTLAEAGMDKVREGITTLEELRRVLPPPDAK